MAKLLENFDDWLQNPNDTSSIANAKLALMILKLVQTMHSQINRRNSTGFGELLGPVMLRCPHELLKALGKALSESMECTENELSSALGLSATADAAPPLSTASKRSRRISEIVNNEATTPLKNSDLLNEDFYLYHETLLSRQQEVIETMTSGMGDEFIVKMAKKPSPRSRQLFSAATKLLLNFLAKSETDWRAALGNNVELLRSALDLDESDVRFLELACIVQRTTVDTTIFSFVDRPLLLRQALSLLCGIDPRKQNSIMNAQGSLRSSGLLEKHNGYQSDLGDLLRLTSVGDRLLSQPFHNMQDMASAVLKPVTPTTGAALEWPHLQTESYLLAEVLRTALAKQTTGINILLHGAPGTGKTEFSKYLCAQLACSAYAVVSTDEHGKEAERVDRLNSLQLCQRLSGKSGSAVLVLDEAEDIFQNTHGSFFGQLLGKRRDESKGWTNELLETNKHPVIWISNTISHLDPAYVRRFAYVMEFRTPPRAQRLMMAEQHLAPVGTSADLLQRLSHNPHLTPAMLASAARFTALAQTGPTDLPPKSTPDQVVQHHIQKQIQALGLSTIGAVPDLVTRFDTRYLNIKGKTAAEQVTASLVRSLRGTAVFAGPPGTGKTQMAAHIAERANLELLYRTASDINSMWFGQSEANVAKLFEDCDVNHQMILLDEADVLLMTRDSAVSRPERAVTAEFLRRLEAFKGIFICATNHSDMFDAALMRRFVFRLEFAPLTLPQRCQMFAEVALQVPATDITPDLPTSLRQALTKLDRLTPGDFANVKKRFTTLGQTANTEDWLTELQQEQAAKGERGNTPMGFVN